MTTTPTKLFSKLHTCENIRDELDALFDPKRYMSSKPFNQRNLPVSFFRPPEFGSKTPSHSRQNSVDQTTVTNVPTNLKQIFSMNTPIGHHLRSVSEPVQMSNTLSLPNSSQTSGLNNHQLNSNNPVNNHQRQFSVCNELPMPHGWEVAKTSNGQRYFVK
jgi:protein yorkie